MSEFQKAAEKATAQVTRWYDDTIGCGVYPNDSFVRKAIIREFAELEAKYAKLVELVRNLRIDHECEDSENCRFCARMSDPQIQAAIGGKDETK